MESYFNSDCRETYTITPVTYMYLTPETDRLFRMDDYPERLSKWMQRFMQHIAGSFFNSPKVKIFQIKKSDRDE